MDLLMNLVKLLSSYLSDFRLGGSFSRASPLEESNLGDTLRARRPAKPPHVLSKVETLRLLTSMEGTSGLIASVLYRRWLRILEVLRLRTKDVDFEPGQIIDLVD